MNDDKATHEQFARTIQALCATYQREHTEALVYGYWLGLSDLPLDVVQAAAADAIRSPSDFMPTPGKLRRLSGEQSPEEMALDAWQDLREGIRVGPYGNLQFRDPVITATLRLLWRNLFEACIAFEDPEQEKWLKKDFMAAYSTVCNRGIMGDEARMLSGAAGVPRESPPVVIGEERNGKLLEAATFQLSEAEGSPGC